MTINTFTTTSLTTWFYPAEQNNSVFSSAAVAPIRIIPKEVIEMVAEAGIWHELGLKLGLSRDALEAIRAACGSDQIKAAEDMLCQWVNSSAVAKPADLCNTLDELSADKISHFIRNKLQFNTEYFSIRPQSSADTNCAPEPKLGSCYLYENSQSHCKSGPAFIVKQPPLPPQELVAKRPYADGQPSAPYNLNFNYHNTPHSSAGIGPAFIATHPPLPQELVAKRPYAAGQPSAPYNLNFNYHNTPHSSADIGPALINREDMYQQPQGCRRLTGDAAGDESEQLKQMKSKLKMTGLELSQAQQKIISLRMEINSREKDLKNLNYNIASVRYENEKWMTQSQQHLIHSITVPQPGAERVNSENAAQKAKKEVVNLRIMFERFKRDSNEKSALNAQKSRLKEELNSALKTIDTLKNELIEVQTEKMLLKKNDLSPETPASESQSSSLPSAAIVPGKNIRGASRDDSVRPALINREDMYQQPQGCRRLTGDAAGDESEQLKQMKSELKTKDQQLMEVMEANDNLVHENEERKAEKAEKAEKDTAIERLETIIEEQRKQLQKILNDKSALEDQVSKLKDERDFAFSETEDQKMKLTQDHVQNTSLKRKQNVLSSGTPASESQSCPLPSAAIVPGKNTRSASRDDSVRPAAKKTRSASRNHSVRPAGKNTRSASRDDSVRSAKKSKPGTR